MQDLLTQMSPALLQEQQNAVDGALSGPPHDTSPPLFAATNDRNTGRPARRPREGDAESADKSRMSSRRRSKASRVPTVYSDVPLSTRRGDANDDHSTMIKVTVTHDGKQIEEELDPIEVARLYATKQAALQQVHRKFDFTSVPDWVQLHPLLGSYLAEAFGTFAWVLVFSLTGVRNQSIFDVGDDASMTSVPIGFMFTSLVFTFAYVSGGHFNPAISIAVFFIRRLDLVRCVGYIICQLAAAVAAGLAAMLIQGSSDIFVPSVTSSYVSSGIFSEMIFTFALAIVVLNIGYSRQTGSFFYGFAIGMTMVAGSASVGRISGGAFNPAAATGLQIAICLSGSCDQLKSFWIYWFAPLVGAAVAALFFSQMAQPTNTEVMEGEEAEVMVERAARVRPTAPPHGEVPHDSSSEEADEGGTQSTPAPTPHVDAQDENRTLTDDEDGAGATLPPTRTTVQSLQEKAAALREQDRNETRHLL